ncbi:type II toxin-antitoxin system HicA family toxin [Curtobacterium sp. MMLR14_010]|uniref:type II toxin-antitoxin system HicA family toxin n=1 Tax=Curtobacterium sp. MMLR14_010 TaxID=1898743 RepID=UPI001113D76C
MTGAELFRVVQGLGYTVARQSGSHRRMKCEGRPPLTFAFHDSASLPPGLVKKVLMQDAGLSEDQALACL